MPSTLVLSRSDVMRHVEGLTLLEELRSAFRAWSERTRSEAQRAVARVHDEGAAMVVFPGVLPGIPAYSVKVHAKYPGRTPSISGVVHLHDLESGELLALMDSGQLAALRTGLVAALSVDVLAPAQTPRVALIGAGRTASVTLRCLRLVRSLERVRIYDPDTVKSFELASRTYDKLSLPAEMVDSIDEAVADADVVILTTWSREPLIFPGMVKSGCHVASLGADELGKVELSPNLIRQSRFFCDDRELQRTSGILGTARLDDAVVAAELGEVIAGKKPGRTSPEEITLFSSVGLPFQDLVAAWSVYESAKHDDSVQRVDFDA